MYASVSEDIPESNLLQRTRMKCKKNNKIKMNKRKEMCAFVVAVVLLSCFD